MGFPPFPSFPFFFQYNERYKLFLFFQPNHHFYYTLLNFFSSFFLRSSYFLLNFKLKKLITHTHTIIQTHPQKFLKNSLEEQKTEKEKEKKRKKKKIR